MLYFHDPEKRQVICAPDLPSVVQVEGKGREPASWIISAELEVVSAHNYLKPNGQWAFPVRYQAKEEYLESKDTQAEAVRWFISSNYPHGKQVEYAEYMQFRKLYEDASNGAKPKKING